MFILIEDESNPWNRIVNKNLSIMHRVDYNAGNERYGLIYNLFIEWFQKNGAYLNSQEDGLDGHRTWMDRHVLEFGQRLQVQDWDLCNCGTLFFTNAGCKAQSIHNNMMYRTKKSHEFIVVSIELKAEKEHRGPVSYHYVQQEENAKEVLSMKIETEPFVFPHFRFVGIGYAQQADVKTFWTP